MERATTLRQHEPAPAHAAGNGGSMRNSDKSTGKGSVDGVIPYGVCNRVKNYLLPQIRRAVSEAVGTVGRAISERLNTPVQRTTIRLPVRLH